MFRHLCLLDCILRGGKRNILKNLMIGRPNRILCTLQAIIDERKGGGGLENRIR
jgi:hypothetical protein